MGWIELSLIFGVILFLWQYGLKHRNYWTKKGIEELASSVPFLGEFYRPAFRMEDPLVYFNRFYYHFKDKRFGGMYFLQVPFLLIRDPDLLKQIMIKDTDHFLNRYDFSVGADPIMSQNLSALKDEKWRNLRMVMTTVFTASKMKDMFTFMEKCAKQSTEILMTKIKNQNNVKGTDADVLEMDFKEYFSRYGTDVIASTAFGVEVDSFKNPDNEFYAAGSAITDGLDGKNAIKLTLLMMFPMVAKMLKLKFFGKKLNDFLFSTVSSTIREREKHNIVRKDVIHILKESRKMNDNIENGNLVKVKLPELTDEDIAAQAVLFYFGGFETMGTLLGFLSYELALHPDIQQQVYEEVKTITEANEGVTYDGIMHQMKYLDMVINETLRKWPPAAASDRIVTKRYTIPKTENSPEVILEPGDKVMIPISSLHRDPKHFPDPEKFDPERFRDEKDTVKNFTFLPFGGGMRGCIGTRYALMEAKTIFVHLIKEFEIVPIKRTEIPIKLQKSVAFLLRSENGFWLGLKQRK
ncbi:hypothetical protein RUM43_000336 [Polyplax serrata]|uniref:Cytochrome P450 n=1 Tax=Polyplax serrata TaxID=468196 RepID=A0AAN8SFT1_POLSC